MSKTQHFTCPITGKTLPNHSGVPVSAILPQLIQELREKYPQLLDSDRISPEALAQLRVQHVQHLLENDKGELSKLEKEVYDSFEKNELLVRKTEETERATLTFGERLADRIASFGGSWRFIIAFGVFIGIWMIINTVILMSKPFDPYPFILLNLILSCLAALQAPVIMMSQNRMETKDRQRATNDYQINLKAELEIRHLHEKMDHLITKQMQHLNEIQEIQIDLLNELVQQKKK